MTTKYSDYYWKNGAPIGVKGVSNECFFKIVSDPYQKHISIEQYIGGKFDKVVYDSHFIDFRYMKPVDQIGWEKERISEHKCLIRDQNDRLVSFEKHQFEKGLSRVCKIYAPQGFLLAINRLSYKFLGDDFNGVTLYDTNQHPIMVKKYEAKEGEFTVLLEESWNPAPL